MHQLIKCHSINYRQGFIQVSAKVHDGCINLESWNIHSEVNIKNHESLDELTDSSVLSNVELELSVEEAKELINKLNTAINQSTK